MSETHPPVVELVPHEPPMLLIDEVVSFEGERIVAKARVHPDSLFVEDGRLAGIVLIEHMAQTVAAYAGLRGRARGEPPQIGFLIGCRQMTVDVDWLDAGDELLVQAERVWGETKLGHFECEVSRAGTRIAQASLNVLQGTIEGMEFE